MTFSVTGTNYQLSEESVTVTIMDDDRQGILVAEDFDRINGPITLDPSWETHSGASETTVVQDGSLLLTDAATEDVHTILPGAPFHPDENLTLYAAFDLTLLESPSGEGSYFAHFKGASKTAFRGRIYIKQGDEPQSTFQLGILSGSLDAPSFHSKQLQIMNPYRIVASYQLATGQSQLWIDPADEEALSFSSPDQAQPIEITSFAFRQTGSTTAGIGSHLIDNLSIGSTFKQVQGAQPVLPVVAITNHTPTINEADSTPASWTITRSGALDQSLPIQTALSGTANPLEDFNILFSPEQIVFEPNQSALTLRLFPVDNEVKEGPESVVLSILDGPGYHVGPESTAEITISDDNDLPHGPVDIQVNAAEIWAQLVPGQSYELQESDDLVRWVKSLDVKGSQQPFRRSLDPQEANQRFYRLVPLNP